MNKTKTNKNNLFQLWKVAGQSFQSYFEEDGIYCSFIKSSQWPNRIWIDELLSEESIQKVSLKIEKYNNFTFSHFNTEMQNISLISPNKFTLKSEQYGMSLSPTTKFKTSKNINFRSVRDEKDAKKWNEGFYDAFQYEISIETILQTKDEIPYIIVLHEQELVGTIILFETHKTLGIHSLGIISAKRRQGFAIEIMRHCINNAVEQNISLMTLQASEMAKYMYLKLGFSLDFKMENYRLNNNSKTII